MIVYMILAALLIFVRSTDAHDQDWLHPYTLYTHQEYEASLAAYEKVSVKNAACWYTMANAAYKVKDYPHAMLYWLRSQRHGSLSLLSDSSYNIAVLQEKLEFEQHHLQDTIRLWWYSIQTIVPLVVIQIFCVIILYFLLIRYRKHRGKMLSFLTFIWLCISMGLMYVYTHQRPLIVLGQQASVYAGPDECYTVLGTLEPARHLAVYDTRSAWYKIWYHTTYGWIPQSTAYEV